MRSIIVGAAGHQGRIYTQILSKITEVVGVVDVNIQQYINDELFENYECFTELDKALIRLEFDVALLCVPHHLHFVLTEKLVKHGVAVIKEKPFATSFSELKKYLCLMVEYQKPIFIISQRQHKTIFKKAIEQLPHIGDILSYDYSYYLSKSIDADSWRSNYMKSKGGVVLDMGYHVFNVLTNFFNIPQKIYVNKLYFDNSNKKKVEHFANLVLLHDDGFVGNVFLSSYAAEKSELFSIYGAHGILKINNNRLIYKCHSEKEALSIFVDEIDAESFQTQLVDFINNLNKKDYIFNHVFQHIKTMNLILDAYSNKNCISNLYN